MNHELSRYFCVEKKKLAATVFSYETLWHRGWRYEDFERFLSWVGGFLEVNFKVTGKSNKEVKNFLIEMNLKIENSYRGMFTNNVTLEKSDGGNVLSTWGECKKPKNFETEGRSITLRGKMRKIGKSKNKCDLIWERSLIYYNILNLWHFYVRKWLSFMGKFGQMYEIIKLFWSFIFIKIQDFVQNLIKFLLLNLSIDSHFNFHNFHTYSPSNLHHFSNEFRFKSSQKLHKLPRKKSSTTITIDCHSTTSPLPNSPEKNTTHSSP